MTQIKQQVVIILQFIRLLVSSHQAKLTFRFHAAGTGMLGVQAIDGSDVLEIGAIDVQLSGAGVQAESRDEAGRRCD